MNGSCKKPVNATFTGFCCMLLLYANLNIYISGEYFLYFQDKSGEVHYTIIKIFEKILPFFE